MQRDQPLLLHHIIEFSTCVQSNSLIFKKVISDMFFHSNGHSTIHSDSSTKVIHTLLRFGISDSQYNVTIKNPLKFQLIITYLISGLSFRQAENVLSYTSNAQLGSLSHSVVTNYMSLYVLSIFKSFPVFWTTYKYERFPLWMIHQNITETLTSMIRFIFIIVTLYSIYIYAVAISMFDHIPTNICTSLFSNFLNIICIEWCGKLNSIGWWYKLNDGTFERYCYKTGKWCTV